MTHQTDYEKFARGFASLSYHDFTLDGGASWREKGIPTGSYNSIYGDDRAKATDNRAYTNLKFERKFGADWDITANLSYDYYGYHGDYPYDYGAPLTNVIYRPGESRADFSARVHDEKDRPRLRPAQRSQRRQGDGRQPQCP